MSKYVKKAEQIKIIKRANRRLKELRAQGFAGTEAYKKAAYFEYPPALHRLALLYTDGGSEIKQDKQKAIRYLEMAAEKGHPESKTLLETTKGLY